MSDVKKLRSTTNISNGDGYASLFIVEIHGELELHTGMMANVISENQKNVVTLLVGKKSFV